jgi:hypothetical protein
MVKGATFTLENQPTAELPPAQLHAETLDVEEADGRTTIQLRWSVTSVGDPEILEEEELPQRIVVTNAGVWLRYQGDQPMGVGPPQHPEPAVDDQRPSGLYTQLHHAEGERIACFGQGPPRGAAPRCTYDDVCFHLCLSPTRGFIAVDGTWTVHYGSFAKPPYAAPWGIDVKQLPS